MYRMRRFTHHAIFVILAASGASIAFAQDSLSPSPPLAAPASADLPKGERTPTVESKLSPPPTSAALGSGEPLLGAPASPRDVLASWQQALVLVRSQATSLRRSAAQIRLAKAQADQALARLLPTLSGSASVGHHLLYGRGSVPPYDSFPLQQGPIPDPGTTWQAGLELRVPLVAPQAWYDAATARLQMESSTINARETERQLLAGLADSIVSVVTAERLAEVSRVSLDSSLSTLELTRRRARFGAATALDVLRSEQEVTRARTQVISSNEALRRTREALGVALGTSRPWGVTPAIRVDALADDIQALCHATRDVDQRADIRYARSRKELADRAVISVDKTYWPTLDASSTMTYGSSDRTTANREHVTWTIGALLSWRLFDGGLRHAQHQVQVAQSTLAAQDLIDAERQARLEIEQSERGVRVAEANLSESRRSRDLSRETLRLARTAFVNGTGTSFELVEAERQLRQSEIDLTVKEFDLVRARLAAMLVAATCEV